MNKYDLVKLGDVCEILDSMRVPITASDRKTGIYPYYGANGIQDYVNDFIFDDELVLLAEDGGNFGSETRPIAYRVSGKCWVNNHAHVLKAKSMLDIDYLCYSIMFYDVSNIISGTTRAKLNQAAMRKMQIPLPPLEVQRKIAETLDAASKLLAMRKKQLAELDKLIQSVFYDMFGDPVTNEKGWERTPVKNVSSVRGRVGWKGYKRSDLRDSGPLVLGATHLTDAGNIKLTEPVYISSEKYKESPEIKLELNDLIFVQRGNTIGKVGLLDHDIGNATINPCVLIIRPIKVNPIYLKSYFLLDSTRRDVWSQNVASAQPMITQKGIGEYQILIPPLQLQTQFTETVQKIEEQKALVKKAIDEIQALFDSLMNEYFE